MRGDEGRKGEVIVGNDGSIQLPRDIGFKPDDTLIIQWTNTECTIMKKHC